MESFRSKMSQLCSAAEATKRFAFVLFDLDNRRDEHQPPPTTNHHQPPPTTTNHHHPPAVPTVRTRYAISVQSVIESKVRGTYVCWYVACQAAEMIIRVDDIIKTFGTREGHGFFFQNGSSQKLAC